MQNRPIFIKVRNFVNAQGYTIEQVQNATPAQIKNVLNLTDLEFSQYKRWVDGIKKLIIQDLQAAIDRAELLELKAIAETWILAHFPKAEWQRDNDVVTIYLKGNPDGE